VEVDDLDAGPAWNGDELPPQLLELLIGRVARRLETRQLGLPIVAEDSSLGDGHPDVGQVCGPDRDAA
jgi:hypothetical protein